LTDAPDVRRYPARPIAGVGALIVDGDRILLVERGKEPLKGYWSLPGGAIEVGETAAEALQREVKEETGLDVAVGDLVEIFERIMRDETGKVEYHYVLIDHLCHITGGEAVAGSDVANVRWARRDELPSIRLTSGTLDVIERMFAGRS